MALSLQFQTLNSLAFWFIKKLSAVQRLFTCGSDFKILTFSNQLRDHAPTHAGIKLTFPGRNP